MIDLTPILKAKSFYGGAVKGFEMLGHGEYNVNYTFDHPATGQKLVLRVPMGSQMHLPNQVRYEYEALRLLALSGRTPLPVLIDDSKTIIPYGFLVMSFLPGCALVYENDLKAAAECLADIHNPDIPADTHLLAPHNPLAAVLDECHAMIAHYFNSPLAVPTVTALIKELLARGQGILAAKAPAGRRCLINTELNSGNFLVNPDKAYLVDWEKPLYAYPGQDLGHFLAPTTTLWKTDTILTPQDIHGFMQDYADASNRHKDADEIWAATKPYFAMNCLRGITWCAMAWIQYQGPDRALKDPFTFAKIKSYLEPEFLTLIKERYLHEN